MSTCRNRVSTLLLAALPALLALAIPPSAAAQEISTSVTAPDGVALATDVYLPASFLAWPTVLVRTPYGREGMAETCRVFNLLGYACVVQDTRGRGGSEGSDTVFRDAGPDGRATVAWVAAQSWCDGRIGTFGGSALGITQYLLAPEAPEALRCILPVVATADVVDGVYLQDGVLRESLVTNWLAGQGSLHVLDELREHRLRDPWWDPLEVLAEAGDVEVPGLHIGGWFDIFQQGTIDAWDAFQHRGGGGARGRQYLVMGPWTHGEIGGNTAGELTYPADALLDTGALMLDWYARWLQEQDAGVDEWPAVRVFLMGAVGEPSAPGNVWVELPDWPPPARTRSWMLSADGRLSRGAAAAGDVPLTIDPLDPVPTLGGPNLFPDLIVDGRPMGAGPYDQRPIEARSDVLTFTSPVLGAPLTVMGPLRARLWVRPDTPDLDLAVRLTDVYPDGRSMLIADGIVRARYRCGDDRECFLVPGEPVELEVDLWSTAMVFNAGHRLRLDVSGSNWPRFEVNPNHDGPIDAERAPVVAHPVILTGPEHPSRLVVPVVSDAGPRLPRTAPRLQRLP